MAVRLLCLEDKGGKSRVISWVMEWIGKCGEQPDRAGLTSP
jgi:hypothetical protein